MKFLEVINHFILKIIFSLIILQITLYAQQPGEVTSVPEILSPAAGSFVQYKSNFTIRWKCEYTGRIRILFSQDNGKIWIVIRDDESASRQEWTWFVSNIKSKQCLIKILSLTSGELNILSKMFTIGDINDYYTSKWNGLLPHLQPFNTTDYYGSGDVNGDAVIDDQDAAYLNDIVSGKAIANIRADVNGDGKISSEDLALVSDAVHGDTLPAWWNLISDAKKKAEWLKKMLCIDKTNEHEYIPGKYECSNFAQQLFRNFTGYNEFSGTSYSSQTIYNIPVYYVLINPPSGTAHNLNTVLLGRDALQFSDWQFIEPQNDEYVNLNQYPAGTTVTMLSLPTSVLVQFQKSPSGSWNIEGYNHEMIRSTAEGQFIKINSSPFIWYPVLIGTNKVLFERSSDDMSRRYCLHTADLDSVMQNNVTYGRPLRGTELPSHIVYNKANSDGSTHLIWEEISGDDIIYYYGTIYSGDQEINNIQQLGFFSNGNYFNIRITGGASEGYMFWQIKNSDQPDRIFLSRMLNSLWQPARYIDPGKSNFILCFEPGQDEQGNYNLFVNIPINRNYWSKILIYTSENDWSSPCFADTVEDDGTNVFHADNRFFMKAYGNYIYTFSKQNGNWSCTGFLDYGRPSQILESRDKENTVYIVGEFMSYRNYIPYYSSVTSSLQTNVGYITRDPGSTVSSVTGSIKDNLLTIAWQERSQNRSLLEFRKIDMSINDVDDNHSVISQAKLLQNYPNPFNPATNIHYHLPSPGSISLIVYDALGRELNILVNEYKEAGDYKIIFDGSMLPSGVYFYRLRAGGFNCTMKMLLIK